MAYCGGYTSGEGGVGPDGMFVPDAQFTNSWNYFSMLELENDSTDVPNDFPTPLIDEWLRNYVPPFVWRSANVSLPIPGFVQNEKTRLYEKIKFVPDTPPVSVPPPDDISHIVVNTPTPTDSKFPRFPDDRLIRRHNRAKTILCSRPDKMSEQWCKDYFDLLAAQQAEIES